MPGRRAVDLPNCRHGTGRSEPRGSGPEKNRSAQLWYAECFLRRLPAPTLEWPLAGSPYVGGPSDDLGRNRGQLEAVQGQGKGKWGDLTDDDLTMIAGKRDQLAGKLQERYGFEKARAERELDYFVRGIKV
jgi:uncharacterized protein YjbJ (UPF0337 family)